MQLVILLSFIAIGRVYLGVHGIDQVLFGAAIGIYVLYLWYNIGEIMIIKTLNLVHSKEKQITLIIFLLFLTTNIFNCLLY